MVLHFKQRSCLIGALLEISGNIKDYIEIYVFMNLFITSKMFPVSNVMSDRMMLRITVLKFHWSQMKLVLFA